MIDKHFARRNLPHLYFNTGIYFITARISGTLPFSVINSLKKISNKYRDIPFEEFRKHFVEYDDFLDKNFNSKIKLTDNFIPEILSECLLYPDGKEYKLLCYTIMPTHFHFAFELLPNNKGISKIMQSIKGISSRRINTKLNREGKFWQDESYDRLIRNDVELYYVIRYILENPVKARLVKNWYEWNYTFCKKEFIVL
ncbi:MAG: transposase [Ignavibacterium sp.]|nr:transposase [Ignavibacterium sp.]MDW8376450.1 transposase [Ignavibacteriales bacterium]